MVINKTYVTIWKPSADYVIGSIVLVFLLPLLLILWLVGFVSFKGANPIFRQKRTGFKGTLFYIYKFRTMRNQTDNASLAALTDNQRITPYGQFLRRTSLDEIPQLWNVVKGDISFVGPRPLLPAYTSLYTPKQLTRLMVKPGITGLAQINGRTAIDWPTKLAYDAEYVCKQGFILDLVILAKTPLMILKTQDEGGSFAPFTNGH